MNAPTDTPNTRCAQLADYLADVACEELAPVIRPLLPADRKAAVRAYWLGRIAECGCVGKDLAQRLNTSPMEAPV